tara:strand:- start:3276 stop:4439 length:1164 start_codon:yes stop_codon:yes gene_type:complete
MNKIIKLSFRTPDGKTSPVEHFDANQLGYYIGSSSRWNDRNTQIMKQLDDSTNKNNLDNIDNQTFYRCKKLSLPREKMNSICEKYNAKVIRDINAADRIIISRKYLEFITKNIWSNVIYGADLLSIIDLINKTKPNTFSDALKIKLNNLEADVYYIMNVPYGYYNESDSIEIFHKALKKGYNSKGYHCYIETDDKEMTDTLLSNQSKLVWDTALAEKATEDSLIINTEIYERLCQMFKGNDKENYTLGLEMMANCNFEKSKGFLALLFFRFTESQFKSVKSWNHVNVKAMRQKFEKYNLSYARHNASPYDQFIKHLAKDKGLTTFVMEAMLDTVYENVVESTFGLSADTVFEFTRSNLKLKAEYAKKCIDKNIGEVLLKEAIDDLPF